jgi:hypothetical protein
MFPSGNTQLLEKILLEAVHHVWITGSISLNPADYVNKGRGEN